MNINLFCLKSISNVLKKHSQWCIEVNFFQYGDLVSPNSELNKFLCTALRVNLEMFNALWEKFPLQITPYLARGPFEICLGSVINSALRVNFSQFYSNPRQIKSFLTLDKVHFFSN